MRILHLYLLIFLLLGASLSKAQEIRSYGKNGKIRTFEPDKNATEEREKKLESDLDVYQEEALIILTKIKNYLEQLSSPAVTYERRLKAFERRLERLFNGDPAYRGYFLDENLEMKRQDMTLFQYIEFLKKYSHQTASLARVCWKLDAENPKFSTDAAEKKGLIRGVVPADASHTSADTKEWYHVYKATGYLQEEVAFFRDNIVHRVTFCKEVKFYLRYLEVTGPDDAIPKFDWIVYASAIQSSKKGNCGNLKGKFDCEPPPPPEDTCVAYQPVPLWTHLVPGLGWRTFKPGKKYPLWPTAIINVASLGAITTGIVYKFDSDKNYELHQDANTFRELDQYYDLANDSNQKFILFTGGGLFLWALSDALIIAKDAKQRKLFETRFGGDPCASTPPPEIKDIGLRWRPRPLLGASPDGSASVGLSLRLKF